MNLTNLIDGSSDFKENHLYTTSSALKNFLNQKQAGGDWESYQTFATDIPHVEQLASCGGDEPCFATIVEAMAASTRPTVVLVAEEDYDEHVEVADGVTLDMTWSADFSCDAPTRPVVISGPARP